MHSRQLLGFGVAALFLSGCAQESEPDPAPKTIRIEYYSVGRQ